MPQKKNNAKRGKKDITLRDVVVHVGHMGQRLSSEVKSMEKRLSSRMDGMEKKIETNTVAIADLKKTLTERIDALDEDLTATRKDSLRIRQFVGMPVPTE